MMARSRMSSSEFGARSHSLRLAFSYSRPIHGVTSKYLNLSRAPLSFNGSLIVEPPLGASLRDIIGFLYTQVIW